MRALEIPGVFSEIGQYAFSAYVLDKRLQHLELPRLDYRKGGKMKIKKISILLFILAFAGVAVVGANLAWAVNPLCASAGIDLSDTCCSDAEKAADLCIEAYGYIVQVDVPLWSDPTDPNIMEPGEASWEWPILDSGTGNLIWQYKGLITDINDCKAVTWNYFVMEMHQCATANMVDTIPPGAQLLLPGDTVPKCTSFSAAADHYLVKLNPSLNCGAGNFVIFSFTTTSIVQLGHNRAVVTTKKGCAPLDAELLGPDFETAPYLETIEMCGGEIVVKTNVCTGAPDCVEINGKQAAPFNPILCFGDPPSNCIDLRAEFEQAGPASTGCVLDCDPPIYGYGTDYWRENLEPNTPACP